MSDEHDKLRAYVAIASTVALIALSTWLIREVRAADIDSTETQITELVTIGSAIAGLAAIVAAWMKRDSDK